MARIRAGAAIASTAVLIAAGPADATCRQALLFALDVSGSVDTSEYRQQLEGLASALLDEQVRAAILVDDGAPMALAAFEWSSADYSQLIVDWTVITDEAALVAVATRLREWPRVPAPTETGIGAGMEVAAGVFRRAPKCWEMTLDISADGKNNNGPAPKDVHASGALDGVTVNALLVGAESGSAAETELESMRVYLMENVVHGPGAFITVARSYDDYTLAMRRKLLKEVASAQTAKARR